jgi:hypothetical protein
MGVCPFCKGEIADDILTFGGRCPQCLIEIPGEEAPTDPGDEVKAARAAEEAAAERKSPGLLIGAALVALVVGVAAASGAFDSPAEPLPVVATGSDAYKKVSSQFVKFDLDDEPDEEVVEAPKPKQKSAGKTPKKTSPQPKKASAKAAGSLLPDTSKLPVADIDDIPLTDAGDGRPVGLTAPTGSSVDGAAAPAEPGSALGSTRRSTSSLLDDDIGGPPRDRMQGEEYCGEAMREPVKMIMKQLGKQLRSCGDRMLKKDDRFSSSVKVSIAVEKTGNIAAIDLRTSSETDPEFLGCIEKTINRTAFPRFCTGVDLAKTYYFGSQR